MTDLIPKADDGYGPSVTGSFGEARAEGSQLLRAALAARRATPPDGAF
jgi:hypothetical protein